jgi:hypothetical protein
MLKFVLSYCMAALLKSSIFALRKLVYGGLAQLARALAWHARGRRFDPDTLHKKRAALAAFFYYTFSCLHHLFFTNNKPSAIK